MRVAQHCSLVATARKRSWNNVRREDVTGLDSSKNGGKRHSNDIAPERARSCFEGEKTPNGDVDSQKICDREWLSKGNPRR